MNESSLELLEEIRNELKKINHNINIIFCGLGIAVLIEIVQQLLGL